MEHDIQRSQTSSKTAAAATRDATNPGRSSRSALLYKCDRALASGLVKKFTPPKRGVATATVSLRSAPRTGAGSAELETIATDSVMTIQSEVQSTDPGHPAWFGVEFDRRDGFVMAPLVRIEDPPRREEAPETKADDVLFTGPLEQMRLQEEFHQYKNDKTLHRACERALQERGYQGDELHRKVKVFRENVCNYMARFFIEHANDLRSQSKTLKDNYPRFKQLVENWMTEYFTRGLRDKLVEEGGYVNTNAGLDMALGGCGINDSPFTKAQKLLKYEGRLIEIYVIGNIGHFFLGRVTGGFLYAYDPNLGKGRSGKFDLKEVTQESTSGTTYSYLKDILKKAWATDAGTSANDNAEPVEPSTTQPHATPDSPHAAGADHVQAFTPPRLGAATTAVKLRSAPTTNSAKQMLIDPGSVITLQSEVQTADPSYPRWFGAEVGTRSGFVAAPFVKIEEHSGDTVQADPSSAENTANAGSVPGPARPQGSELGDPWRSGHLARMRREHEFIQIHAGTEKGTLHKASMGAFAKLGYKGATLTQKVTTFRDHACNILALFFIEYADRLRSQAEALRDDYERYKTLVGDWMTDYFFDALSHKMVEEDGNVPLEKSNVGLNRSEGCDEGDMPYQKALGLIKCEGRLIRIRTGRPKHWHFFVGEVKNGVLHAYDNQAEMANRSGEFDLTQITQKTKDGDAYRYLKDVLVSASPAKAGAPEHDADEKESTGASAKPSGPPPHSVPGGTQPGAAADQAQVDDADCC